MKVGDKVKVNYPYLQKQGLRNVWDPVYRPVYGIVTFISSKWATVLLHSRRTGKPLYRESFWLHDISQIRK